MRIAAWFLLMTFGLLALVAVLLMQYSRDTVIIAIASGGVLAGVPLGYWLRPRPTWTTRRDNAGHMRVTFNLDGSREHELLPDDARATAHRLLRMADRCDRYHETGGAL